MCFLKMQFFRAKNSVAAGVIILRRCDRSILFSERPRGDFAKLFGNGVIELFFVGAAVHVRHFSVLEDKEGWRRFDSQTIAGEMDRTRIFVTVNANETRFFTIVPSALFKMGQKLFARVARREPDLKHDGAARAHFFIENLINSRFGVKHLRNFRSNDRLVPSLELVERHGLLTRNVDVADEFADFILRKANAHGRNHTNERIQVNHVFVDVTTEFTEKFAKLNGRNKLRRSTDFFADGGANATHIRSVTESERAPSSGATNTFQLVRSALNKRRGSLTGLDNAELRDEVRPFVKVLRCAAAHNPARQATAGAAARFNLGQVHRNARRPRGPLFFVCAIRRRRLGVGPFGFNPRNREIRFAEVGVCAQDAILEKRNVDGFVTRSDNARQTIHRTVGVFPNLLSTRSVTPQVLVTVAVRFGSRDDGDVQSDGVSQQLLSLFALPSTLEWAHGLYRRVHIFTREFLVGMPHARKRDGDATLPFQLLGERTQRGADGFDIQQRPFL
mmetsp:Transcript_6375/g.20867  ORF Transcript_6375/g.20867 Transcript_6375/m.20867 type:complete len:503 (-) Transcript_6375:858-2366(-)